MVVTSEALRYEMRDIVYNLYVGQDYTGYRNLSKLVDKRRSYSKPKMVHFYRHCFSDVKNASFISVTVI